jgi:hypothetical protein
MFFIPGWLISLLTFPGIIVHEFAHRFFADLAKVPVYQVSYFRLGNPAGYVIHGPVKGLKDSFLISIGPLIVNTVLCALITFSAVFPIYILDAEEYSWVFGLLLWIGFSIGMHAFPSNDDLENFVEQVKLENMVKEVKKEKGGVLLLFFARIFAWFLKLANALRVIWFDAIYAFGISMLLPWIFGLL